MQVKAESNAKKAEKAKAAPAAAPIIKRTTPKTTPAASPSVESKLLASADKKVPKKTEPSDKSNETQGSQPKTKDSTKNQNGLVEITKTENETTEIAACDAGVAPTATESETVVENGVETTIITETQRVAVEANAPQMAEQIITTTEMITEIVTDGETVSTKTVITEIVTSDGETVVTEIMTGGQSDVPDTVTEAVSTTETVVLESANESNKAVVTEATTSTVTEACSNGKAAVIEEVATSQAADTPAPADCGADEAPVTAAPANDVEGTPSSDKPVAGYATEEEYKSVLAEKRRLAREAREREQELEKQREVSDVNRTFLLIYVSSTYCRRLYVPPGAL